MKWTPEEDAVLKWNMANCKTKIAGFRATSEQLKTRSIGGCDDRWTILKRKEEAEKVQFTGDYNQLSQRYERLVKALDDTNKQYEGLLGEQVAYIEKHELLKNEYDLLKREVQRYADHFKQKDVEVEELKRLLKAAKEEKEESLKDYKELLKFMNLARVMYADNQLNQKSSYKMDLYGSVEYAR